MYPAAKQHQLEAAPTAEVQKIRQDQAPARTFYKAEHSYGKTLDAKGNQVGIVRDLALAVMPRATDGQLGALVPELAVIAADAGMTHDDLGMLASAIREATTGEPLTKAQVDAKQLEVIGAIRKATALDGPNAFDRAFADARAVATRDPRLKQILDETGAFNNVRVAMRFVELGKEARRRGELK